MEPGIQHECLDDLAARTKDIADTDKPTVLSAAATFKGAHGIEGVRIKDPVMTAVNANNVAKDASGEGSAVIVDKEQILGWNPDIIFLDSGGVSLVKQDAKENPDYYTKLSAFQSGHVYQYPSSTSYYSNLEIPLANSYYVGSLLYPEQFSDINMDIRTFILIETPAGYHRIMKNLLKRQVVIFLLLCYNWSMISQRTLFRPFSPVQYA